MRNSRRLFPQSIDKVLNKTYIRYMAAPLQTFLEALELENTTAAERYLKGTVYRPTDKRMLVGTDLTEYGFHKSESLADDQIEIWMSKDGLSIVTLSADGDGHLQVLSSATEVVETLRDFKELLAMVLRDERVN